MREIYWKLTRKHGVFFLSAGLLCRWQKSASFLSDGLQHKRLSIENLFDVQLVSDWKCYWGRCRADLFMPSFLYRLESISALCVQNCQSFTNSKWVFFSSRLAKSCIPVASLVLNKSYIIMINFAVYPSLEIIRLETPSLQPGVVSPYFLEPHETLQWNCSVQAGEGDRLVWLLNGTVIPSSLVIDTQQVCKIFKKALITYPVLVY